MASGRGLEGRDRAVDELRSFLEDHPVKESMDAAELRRFEPEVQEKLLEVQRTLLADAMAAADAIEVQGRVLRRTLRSSQTYMTSCGPVEVERWLYRDVGRSHGPRAGSDGPAAWHR